MNKNAEAKRISILYRIVHSDKIGLIIALLLVIVAFTVLTEGKFFTGNNIINILISSSIVGLVVIGECYLLITGHVDLSPGSVAAFSGVLIAILLRAELPLALAIVIIVLGGLCVGFFNSLLVNKLKLEAFIATLATMSIFRGFAYIICGGKAVFVTNDAFLKMGAGRILNIPIPVIIFLVSFIIFMIILRSTRSGVVSYILATEGYSFVVIVR